MKSDSANKLVKVSSVVQQIFGDDLHKKRQQSLAYAAMGVLASESLFLHRIAEGLSDTRGKVHPFSRTIFLIFFRTEVVHKPIGHKQF
jgi:hypothetical protein